MVLQRPYLYQLPMLQYCRSTDSIILFVYMRYGKSFVVCRRLQELNYNKILIVAPVSAIFDWKKELQSLGESDICFLFGTRKKRLKLLKENHKWNLINTSGWQALPEISTIKWESITFDESTNIINPSAKITKFYCKYFKNVKTKIILAGIYRPKSDLDFFMQYLFVDNGKTFGINYYEFRAKNCTQQYFKWVLRVKNKVEIISKIKNTAFILGRNDVPNRGGMLKPLTYSTALNTKSTEIYIKAVDFFMLNYGKETKKTIYAMNVVQWLRDLANGFVLGSLVWNGKLLLLDEVIGEHFTKSKVIIFTETRKEQKAIKEHLEKYRNVLCINGDVSKENREVYKNEFNNKKCDTLVCTSGSMIYGANLSAAKGSIYYNRPYRYLIRKQTIERMITVYKKEESLVIDLITLDTVDEDFYYSLLNQETKEKAFLNITEKLLRKLNVKKNK